MVQVLKEMTQLPVTQTSLVSPSHIIKLQGKHKLRNHEFLGVMVAEVGLAAVQSRNGSVTPNTQWTKVSEAKRSSSYHQQNPNPFFVEHWKGPRGTTISDGNVNNKAISLAHWHVTVPS
jgi:hypothetical protein